MVHHLIFEGAELAGKSWVMSQIYNYLEPKYNTNKGTLDGCLWFNCDIGIFGTKHGRVVINNYLRIFEELKEKNIIVEKFFISDVVYNKLLNNSENIYKGWVKNKLDLINFKIILIKFPEDTKKIEKRIKDRLNIYPHYKKILKSPEWYISQQKEYEKEVEKSGLPSLIIETDELPDYSILEKIKFWINEK